MSEETRYGRRGVSADKKEVHDAIRGMDKGLYPNAFCKILPDITGGDEDYCNIMHADTAGTKTSLAYLYWKETGDLSVWEGIVQDAIVMNIDDMACTGCIDDIVLSSTVGRNKNLIPAEVITKVIRAAEKFVGRLRPYGVQIHMAGGETADVGDIVRTIDVGITAFGRIKRDQVIENQISPKDVIVGLASFGQSLYETEYNGGMGSNGLTSARHDVLDKYYRTQYPESYDPNMTASLAYCGSRRLSEIITIEGYGSMSLGKLILSPTRTYLPVLKDVIQDFGPQISGIIHCTGGAQTKVMKFVNQRRIIKDQLFELPPLFQIIEEESGTDRKEMYEVFNMGHRMEIYTRPEVAQDIISCALRYGVDARIVGRVEEADRNELIIVDEKGRYSYQ